MKLTEHISTRLKKLTDSDLPSQVAEKTGLDPLIWVAIYQNPGNITVEQIQAFAEGYNVDLTYFVAGF